MKKVSKINIIYLIFVIMLLLLFSISLYNIINNKSIMEYSKPYCKNCYCFFESDVCKECKMSIKETWVLKSNTDYNKTIKFSCIFEDYMDYFNSLTDTVAFGGIATGTVLGHIVLSSSRQNPSALAEGIQTA